jgi:hypothetical protein
MPCFPVAAELAVLGGLGVRRGRDTRLLTTSAASGIAVAVVWCCDRPDGRAVVRTVAGRRPVTVADAVQNALGTFSGATPWLAFAFGRRSSRRRYSCGTNRTAGALAVVFALSALAIPAIVAIARAKQYYFHPRHVLFLLPMVQLAVALIAGRALAAVVRNPTGAAVAGAALGLAATLGAARAYVADPLPFLPRHEDVARRPRSRAPRRGAHGRRAAGLALAHAPREGPAWHLANPTVAFYLERWDLTDRVRLFGVEDPQAAVRTLASHCADGCRARARSSCFSRSTLAIPTTSRRRCDGSSWRRGVRLRRTWSAPAWSHGAARPPKATGVRQTRLDGLTLVEPAARAKP